VRSSPEAGEQAVRDMMMIVIGAAVEKKIAERNLLCGSVLAK
jgi:hypothetical protein